MHMSDGALAAPLLPLNRATDRIKTLVDLTVASRLLLNRRSSRLWVRLLTLIGHFFIAIALWLFILILVLVLFFLRYFKFIQILERFFFFNILVKLDKFLSYLSNHFNFLKFLKLNFLSSKNCRKYLKNFSTNCCYDFYGI